MLYHWRTFPIVLPESITDARLRESERWDGEENLEKKVDYNIITHRYLTFAVPFLIYYIITRTVEILPFNNNNVILH